MDNADEIVERLRQEGAGLRLLADVATHPEDDLRELKVRAHNCVHLSFMFGMIGSGVPEREAMIATLASLSASNAAMTREAIRLVERGPARQGETKS